MKNNLLEQAKELLKAAKETPEKFQEDQTPMTKSELIDLAKSLIKAVKEDPKQFESLNKASAAPPPPKPTAPAVPKTPMQKPAAGQKPAMLKPSAPKPMSMQMTKAQIMEDLKKPWEPKFKKGCK